MENKIKANSNKEDRVVNKKGDFFSKPTEGSLRVALFESLNLALFFFKVQNFCWFVFLLPY